MLDFEHFKEGKWKEKINITLKSTFSQTDHNMLVRLQVGA